MGSYVKSVMKNHDTDSGKRMFDALHQGNLKNVRAIVEKNKDLVSR